VTPVELSHPDTARTILLEAQGSYPIVWYRNSSRTRRYSLQIKRRASDNSHEQRQRASRWARPGVALEISPFSSTVYLGSVHPSRTDSPTLIDTVPSVVCSFFYDVHSWSERALWSSLVKHDLAVVPTDSPMPRNFGGHSC